ncbi:MAG: hypothetical protein ABI328_10045, partial [Gemmatimonadaceae bacterium]
RTLHNLFMQRARNVPEAELRSPIRVSRQRRSSHLNHFSEERDMKYQTTVFGFFVALGLGTLSAPAQTVRGTPADIQAIKQSIEKHASSAREDDVDGMVSTMQVDADARLDDGRFLIGRAENAKFYRGIVAGGPHRMAHRHPPERKQGSEFTLPNQRFGIGCEEVHSDPCSCYPDTAASDPVVAFERCDA